MSDKTTQMTLNNIAKDIKTIATAQGGKIADAETGL